MYIDTNEIQTIIQKANIYVRDENLLVSEFKEIFGNLTYLYKTNNTPKINSLCTDINLALEKISTNSFNNNIVFDKAIQKYDELSKETTKTFSELGDINFKSDL